MIPFRKKITDSIIVAEEHHWAKLEEKISTNLKKLQCLTPERLKNQKLYELHENELWCQFKHVNCPVGCDCYSDNISNVFVDCRNKGLSEFPVEFPIATTHVDLSGNNLRSIQIPKDKPKYIFPNLRKMNLSSNQLHHLDPFLLFNQYPELEILDLKRNNPVSYTHLTLPTKA